MTTRRLAVAAAPISWGQCEVRGWGEQDVMLRAEPAEGEGPRNDVARRLGYLQRALTEVTL